MGAPFTTPSLQELERRREFYKSMEALRISHTANSEGSACFPHCRRNDSRRPRPV